MERFLNAMKAQAGGLDRSFGQPRFAIVTSVDPQRYAARVRMQPEGVLTGWLPILTAWMGSGWGMVCPPRPGDQVLVLAQEGDAENGVIAGASFSDRALPPAASPGELWLVHQSGSSLRLANDGTIRVTGDLHVDGDIHDRAGSLARLRGHYDAHEHFGGGGLTTQPD